jgi:hypothetical protein
MRRTAANIGLLSIGLFAAGGLASCGGSTLGGGSSGDVPITGISGSTGRGTGGIGGSSPPGIGGFIDPGTAGDVGTGAFGGVVGTGAFGGDIGGSGDPMPCETPPPPVCGALCGNGKRDACHPGTAPACASVWTTEDCDGTDFTYSSCQSAGYLSGDLACSATCTTDFSGCHECAPLDSLLAACGPAPISNRNIQAFGLGATDSEVGVAIYDDGTAGLTFARLSPALALTSSTTLEQALDISTLLVAVAPIPLGWVVAVCNDHEVYFHAVGADGREIARSSVVQTMGGDQACMSLTLAGRPGGGPLLVWQTPIGVNATVIAADGLSFGPTEILDYSIGQSPMRVDAAWVGTAFYVGVPIWDNQNYQHTLSLTSVQPDGTTALVRNLLPSDLFDGPSLAAGTGDLRIVYPGLPAGGIAPDDIGVIWQRLTLTGQLASLPVQIAPQSNYYMFSRAVAVGDNTVALVLDSAQAALDIVQVGLDGQIAAPMRTIAGNPGVAGADVVRRGSDVIVAWSSYSGNNGETLLNLARLTP